MLASKARERHIREMLASKARERNMSPQGGGTLRSRAVSLSFVFTKVSGLGDPVWGGYTTPDTDWHFRVSKMLASKARERTSE